MSDAPATELQALGAQLAAARADVDDLARMVSHDLRAPLRHVLAYGDLLREMLRDGEDVGPILGQLERSSRQLGDMLDAVVALARQASAPLQPTLTDGALLVEEARRAAQAMLPESDLLRPVVWQIAPTLPPIHGDAAQLRQALAALLANAVKFTRMKAEPCIAVDGTLLPDGAVCLRVRDNGVGFSPTQAARLFQPFVRLHGARFEGLGTGLAQVQQIVRRHGGTVQADGGPEQGCTIAIRLPPAAAASGTWPASG